MVAPREGGEGNATDSNVMANIYVAMCNNPKDNVSLTLLQKTIIVVIIIREHSCKYMQHAHVESLG